MPTKSRTTNGFVYSSYWGTWSRVMYYECRGTQDLKLNYDIPSCVAVEVNLTAVNPTVGLDWERVKAITIRAHGTPYGPKDEVTSYLPDYVLERMREWLDEALIERLLHEDFLPHIDWVKHRQHCNGGAPFDLIVKTTGDQTVPPVVSQ